MDAHSALTQPIVKPTSRRGRARLPRCRSVVSLEPTTRIRGSLHLHPARGRASEREKLGVDKGRLLTPRSIDFRKQARGAVTAATCCWPRTSIPPLPLTAQRRVGRLALQA